MKSFLFVAAFSSWISHVSANAISATPKEDPWDYQLMAVNAKFVNNAPPEKPIIALTYAMNDQRQPEFGGDEELRVQVKHDDCTSDVNSQVITFKEIVPSASGLVASDRVKLWDVNLEMYTANVMGDALLVTGTNDNFAVKMCVRSEMYNRVDGQEAMISFDETNVQVDVVLSANFEDLFITARADEQREVGGSADVEYTVEACICNESYDCAPEDKHPNEMIRICTRTVDSRVEMMDIREMEFYQNDVWKHTAVRDRSADKLTAVNKFSLQKNGRQITVVETTALPVFFENPDPPAGQNPTRIEVKGVALMRFVGGNRRLEDDPEVAGEEEFSLNINLDPTEIDASPTSVSSGLSLLVSAMALALLL